MKNITGFAFKGNISSSVLEKLDIKNKSHVLSNYKEIENFVARLVDLKPKYILGLGMYSRIDKDKLRIETQCTQNGKKLPINHYLNPEVKSKLAQGIGNSYCNFVSAKIMEAINDGKLNSRYTFIHISKSFGINNAVSEIKAMLKNLD